MLLFTWEDMPLHERMNHTCLHHTKAVSLKILLCCIFRNCPYLDKQIEMYISTLQRVNIMIMTNLKTRKTRKKNKYRPCGGLF